MIIPCPDCATDMDDLDPDREMGSAPPRYRCPFCEVVFERHASAMLREVDV